MKTPIVEYEGDQLEIDFDLDRPQLSICPKCSGDIIRLADGCHICGWSENQSRSVESSISIPCTVKQSNQPERSGVIKQDLGSRFLVYIPDSDSTVTVSKLFVYPDLSQLDKSPRKSSDTFQDCNFPDCDRPENSGSEKVMETSVENPRKIIPTSKKRRQKGYGSGWIQCKPITRNGKQYKQYWYNYEEWRSGSGA